jgi:hypothetical protein
METKNAKITSTMLGLEGHGIMTFFLYLDYEGSVQGAGGYSLISSDIHKDKNAFGIAIIKEILKVVGVDKWEDLKGEYVRVKASSNEVSAIGHILENKWLNFKEFADSFRETNTK